MVKPTLSNLSSPIRDSDSRRRICKPKSRKQKPKNSPSLSPEIEIDETTITSNEYFEKIHEFFKTQNKKKPNAENRVKEYIMEKICEVCEEPKHDDLLLLCDYCDDAYHTYCLKPKLSKVPDEDVWTCPLCKDKLDFDEKTRLIAETNIDEGKNSKGKINFFNYKAPSSSSVKRQSILEEHFPKKNCCEKICDECGENILEQKDGKIERGRQFDQKEFCIKCQKYFHSKCFSKKKNSILCKECEISIKNSIPKNKATLLDYFKKSELGTKSEEQKDQKDVKQRSKSRKKSKTIIYSKQKKTLKLPKFAEGTTEIKLKENLLFALRAKNIEFDDDQRYTENCPEIYNDGNMEPNLQKMDQQTLKIFKQFKEKSKQANYVPVIIEQDKLQGFIVRAFEDISERTIICEYVGDIDFARNRIFDKNDSIMDLLRTNRSKSSLVICPEKYGNIARFLSGINNENKDSKKKQNVQSIRFNVEGKARVILYAMKKIPKGEILYYDYNAGGFGEYPTENFV